MVPRAGSSNGFGISTMTSGLMFQPLGKVIAAGASASLPAGAPRIGPRVERVDLAIDQPPLVGEVADSWDRQTTAASAGW